ncbi:MAG: hypothetical protein ACP6IY_22415 [Promethearchaeia archaeon]
MINFKILRNKINKIRKRLFDFATNVDFINKCLNLVIFLYLGLLGLAVLVAYSYGGLKQGPGEYYIWTNWISDLGSINYTPAPYLYDIAAIVTGALTLPLTFFLEKIFVPLPEKPEDYNKVTRLRFRLGSYAFLTGIIGNIGYIMVGIFSEDRNFYGLHMISSGLAFGGFVFSAFFFGLIIILYDVKISKYIGLYGVVGPFITLILYNIITYSLNHELGPLMEWILLFSILLWLIPLLFSLRKNGYLNKE